MPDIVKDFIDNLVICSAIHPANVDLDTIFQSNADQIFIKLYLHTFRNGDRREAIHSIFD